MEPILLAVCKKKNTNPFMIFLFASEYKEYIFTIKQLSDFFWSYCVVESDGHTDVPNIPEFIENYCWDVMSGKIYFPEVKKKISKACHKYEDIRNFKDIDSPPSL